MFHNENKIQIDQQEPQPTTQCFPYSRSLELPKWSTSKGTLESLFMWLLEVFEIVPNYSCEMKNRSVVVTVRNTLKTLFFPLPRWKHYWISINFHKADYVGNGNLLLSCNTRLFYKMKENYASHKKKTTKNGASWVSPSNSGLVSLGFRNLHF